MPARQMAAWIYPGFMVSAVLALAGCQQSPDAMRTVDAPGVPVALETIEGAPQEFTGKLSDAVVNQASRRRIDLVSDSSPAAYHLKGYVAAFPTEDGNTAVAVVWDVFDASRKRAQRLTTSTIARGQGGDPWGQVAEPQITQVASQSMNELAGFLSTGTVAAPQTGAISDSALGYATPR